MAEDPIVEFIQFAPGRGEMPDFDLQAGFSPGERGGKLKIGIDPGLILGG